MALRCGTHSGSFHADDVLAFGLIRTFEDPDGLVVRTRDLEVLDTCDVLFDVADRYDLPVLSPPIPRTVRFAEASASGSSVLAGRKNKGSAAYRELATSLLKHWRSGKALPTYEGG